MDLSEAAWTDVAAAETDLALLPVGSTEQHGPHAPLGTDAMTAEAVADAGAEAHDGEIVVAPTLPYGVSAEHRQFDGTLWLAPDTFRDVVREVIESLASHGFRRVVLVNGHGGNADALREVAAGVSRSGDAYAVAFTWFESVGDRGNEMGHGGPLETAMIRHHHPDLIAEERIEEAAADAADGWGEWVDGVELAYDSASFTGNGVVGDPASGDADLGAELTERAAGALARVIEAVADRSIDPPPHR